MGCQTTKEQTGGELPQNHTLQPKSDPLEDKLTQHIDKIFEKYDHQKKGYLEMNQFGKLLRQNTGNDFSSQQVQDLLQIADINKNKRLQKSELKTFYRTLIKY